MGSPVEVWSFGIPCERRRRQFPVLVREHAEQHKTEPAHRLREPPDLGLQEVLVARVVAQGDAEAPLAARAAVPRRGVEEAEADVHRRRHGGQGVGVGRHSRDRAAAEPERGHLEAGPAVALAEGAALLAERHG